MPIKTCQTAQTIRVHFYTNPIRSIKCQQLFRRRLVNVSPCNSAHTVHGLCLAFAFSVSFTLYPFHYFILSLSLEKFLSSSCSFLYCAFDHLFLHRSMQTKLHRTTQTNIEKCGHAKHPEKTLIVVIYTSKLTKPIINKNNNNNTNSLRYSELNHD